MNKLLNKSMYCMDRALRELAGARATGDAEAVLRVSKRIAKIGLAIELRSPMVVFARPATKTTRRKAVRV